ncbi:MAG TPA: hypothetical protein VM328_08455 [Fimbriimonadaceae bacterium]|nr:hypothetical protein [Fimbriimonadaceae bacterium]
MNGHLNMAADRELFNRASNGEAGARVYRWDGPWVSLGHWQKAERDLVNPDIVPWVQRPTGGKAVLHGHDVTVAMSFPLQALQVSPKQVRKTYRLLADPMVRALRACGLDCALAEDTAFTGRGPRTADCFAHVSPSDIVHRTLGVKVCGCALRLSEEAVLLQASVPAGAPLVDPARLFKGSAMPEATPWDSASLATALEEALKAPL